MVCLYYLILAIVCASKRPLHNTALAALLSKFRRIMSTVGTPFLQSPGCNEGKARNETLGIHGQKRIELRRSGTITRAFGLCRCSSWLCIRWGSAAPLGLNKCISIINPGLAPRAMQEYRPYRAPLRLPNQDTLLFSCACLTTLVGQAYQNFVAL